MSTTAAPVPANETMHVNSRKVVCDGGEGPLGHPRVYMRITGTEIRCAYCSRRFILEPGAAQAGAADSSH